MEKKVINTNAKKAKGNQNKCSKCGSTNIELNIKTRNLICLDCRNEIKIEKFNLFSDEFDLKDGRYITSGTSDILDDNNLITLKCDSCGAQMVIDTKMAASVKCHWCRNRLSLKNQVPNGAVPDAILPFGFEKQEAVELINNFIGSRKFFADKTFLKDFNLDHTYGVYFPYIIVDANYKANFTGEGEHELRHYTETDSEGNSTDYYDYEKYNIKRTIDLSVKGLTIESTQEKLAFSNNKTNNIINSIMPFDIMNCVKWHSGFLVGYSLEKRDVDVDDVSQKVHVQLSDIARMETNKSLTYYDRGVDWETQNIDVKAERWSSAYLPVWLYSYKQNLKNNSMIHYIAVNGRTKEIMGSIPINMKRLVLLSSIIEIFCILIDILLWTNFYFSMLMPFIFIFSFLLIPLGFIFFFVVKSKYRNKNVRHYYEKETKRIVHNIEEEDGYIRTVHHSTSDSMIGANNHQLNGNKSINFQKKFK